MILEYLAEREDLHAVESEEGFALYRINGDECYIKDIYVRPELRKQGCASRLADSVVKIAKAKNCRWLVGSVSPPATNSHSSLLVLLAYGMRLTKAEKDLIYLSKEI